MTSTQCEKRCSEHKDCKSCLKGTGAEGGWRECRWSTRLNEVRFISNSFIKTNKNNLHEKMFKKLCELINVFNFYSVFLHHINLFIVLEEFVV